MAISAQGFYDRNMAGKRSKTTIEKVANRNRRTAHESLKHFENETTNYRRLTH